MSWSARDEQGAREFFDAPEAIRVKAQQIAQELKSSNHAIVFTGAGLSTAAGIPDFRSGMNTVLKTGPGLWAAQADYEGRNPVRNEATKNDPARPKVNLDAMLTTKPTYSHRAVSKLVEHGLVKTVITQNVDNLHRSSGVPRKSLVELHGNLQCERCERCAKEFVRPYRVGPNMASRHFTGRNCESCGGRLKDYLVPFGEDLPKSETDRAWTESEEADFCLVLGSSMTVTPACDYAGWVGRKTQKWYQNPPASKGSLAIVNLQKTPYDGDAIIKVNSFCDDVMRLVMEELNLTVDP